MGHYTLPLEQLEVSPGDFVTFYARARDIGRGKRPSEARSDIFFLEVTPFLDEFALAQSQAMAGAAGQQMDDLVRLQKDIIVGTWKVDRRSAGPRANASPDAVRTLAKVATASTSVATAVATLASATQSVVASTATSSSTAAAVVGAAVARTRASAEVGWGELDRRAMGRARGGSLPGVPMPGERHPVGQPPGVHDGLERGQPVFTRDISLGGQLHFDALKREFESQGLEDVALMRLLHGQVPSDVSRDQVSGVLREATEQIVGEIRKTIDFYRATAPVERLSRIVLSGGAWQAVGLVDLLGTEFGAPVDIFDPFRRVSKSSRVVGADVSGPAYAVAVGLAMRAEGDR
jgi:hypothetical protein